MTTKQLRELHRQSTVVSAEPGVISSSKIQLILEGEFGYELNPIMFQMFGKYVWIPKNEPMDLTLGLKTISMDELIPIKTESELRKFIKSKLKK